VSADRELVLHVLEGQSPDYYIFPNASAFVAEELDPADVAATLDELHAEGLLERELLAVEATAPANDGGVEYVPGGYRLKHDEEPQPTTKKRRSR
jgi:hypothetical protein